jgi:hypothetical protein
LACGAQGSGAEGIVEHEGKFEGSPMVVSGRVEELRHLEAGERALADAWTEYANGIEGGNRYLNIAEGHRRHAALLATRIVDMGGRPEIEPDDQWILGPTDELATLVLAEQAAQRTYHDHLLDFDPVTMRLVRDRILPDHEDAVELLTGERGLVMQHPEHG